MTNKSIENLNLEGTLPTPTTINHYYYYFSLQTENKIGNEGGKAIANALKENKTLIGLNLRILVY